MTAARGGDGIDRLPGFRRRIIVTPQADHVHAELEDDFHRMALTLRHDGACVTRVEPDLRRAPWSTCPGAQAQLIETFTGVALAFAARRGEKAANCTHLHDLATLAAAHAADGRPSMWDILVSDPVDGQNRAELRRDGETIVDWALRGDVIVAPPVVAGLPLRAIAPFLATLDPAAQEAVRMLRWGAIIAMGRTIPQDQQNDATRMSLACYTFHPARQAQARRIMDLRDFGAGAAPPLADRLPVART